MADAIEEARVKDPDASLRKFLRETIAKIKRPDYCEQACTNILLGVPAGIRQARVDDGTVDKD